jgi:hypothetical protein
MVIGLLEVKGNNIIVVLYREPNDGIGVREDDGVNLLIVHLDQALNLRPVGYIFDIDIPEGDEQRV